MKKVRLCGKKLSDEEAERFRHLPSGIFVDDDCPLQPRLIAILPHDDNPTVVSIDDPSLVAGVSIQGNISDFTVYRVEY